MAVTGFAAIALLAIVTEALTEAVTRLWDRLPTQLVAMAFGVVLSLLCGVDVIEAVGIAQRIPYIGCIITGVLMSRGSNYLHELVKKLDKSA
ncbi:MAG: hypothetical protein IJC18_01575 [Clostridia bacterium]|nr:hypothetical protein [Clostridia bacterium]MBQ9993276.1 hypothetical protein [Clostridia bacterium]